MHFNSVGSPSRNAHLPVVQFGTSGKILTRSVFSFLMSLCILWNTYARCFSAPLSLKFPQRGCCSFVFQRKISSETIMVRAGVGRQNLLETYPQQRLWEDWGLLQYWFRSQSRHYTTPFEYRKKSLIFHSPPLWLANGLNKSCTPFCCARPCP